MARSNVSSPSPVAAEIRNPSPGTGPPDTPRSILLTARRLGFSAKSRATRILLTESMFSSIRSELPSTTWTITSASPIPSRVARNASSSSSGRSWMNPTVSTRIASFPPGRRNLRAVGSRVAKSWSATKTSAPVNRLNRVDFPALVYPTSATTGNPTSFRLW
ncbi:MAG: hypothetical protein A2Z13_07380 [Deltaproteobacteria bacterium RBG_16_64_85]|nr:MAG: hypothetical protein A2Z13_07380 [Deltaproteobacteria bacterium RBG_16_64_85]